MMLTFNMRRGSAPGRLRQEFALLAISLTAALAVGISSSAYAQTESESMISGQVAAGEFAAAIQSASQLPEDRSDHWMGVISQQQYAAGAPDAAFQSISAIGNDVQRARTLRSISAYGTPSHNSADALSSGGSGLGGGGLSPPVNSNPPFGPANNLPGGAQGGITINDFQPLMELIRQTISPDSWDDANGEGTMSAYPAGVYVDGAGLMRRIEDVRGTNLSGTRAMSMADSGNRRWQVPSDLRKISLNRLEKAAQLAAARGYELDDELLNMAGMYEVSYLMLLPETNDVVIAGPAGPWTVDSEGRRINRDTGKPVLQLDDLVVCLRNAIEGDGTFGCSINPREDNLAQTKRFIESTNLRGREWREGLRDALGRQDVEVFGIDPQTHAGYVLVEADYRMKLVGMGLEPSINDIPSYLNRVEVGADGSLPPMDVVRWWFTLNYDDVIADSNREVFGFTGSGVRVLSENEFLDQQGRRVHTGQTFGPTKEFADDFTDHFEQIATAYPVYRQLKNVFDMAIVASLIEGQGLADKAEWNLTYFGSDDSYGRTYQPAKRQTPEEVESVMNHRIITQRREGSTLRHTVVGVSGGVIFTSADITAEESIRTDESLSTQAATLRPEIAETSADSLQWWWD
ncbi:MAG: DUF1598 domain-containing protein [Planctomycetota bacterium]